MKRCSKCGEVKEVSQFPKDKSKKDGLDLWCRECRAGWRRVNKKNEKLRQLRHTKKWRELSKDQLADIKHYVSQICYNLNFKHLEEDILQDVLLRFYQDKKLIVRIFEVRNAVIDSVRKIYGRKDSPNQQARANLTFNAKSYDPKFHDVAEDNDDDSKRMLARWFNAIKEKYADQKKSYFAAVFGLTYKYGLNGEEIAELFGWSASRVHQILIECRDYIKEKGI